MDKRLNDLAVRIDTLAERLVPFEYGDADADADMVLDGLKNNPVGIIEYLVELIETIA